MMPNWLKKCNPLQRRLLSQRNVFNRSKKHRLTECCSQWRYNENYFNYLHIRYFTNHQSVTRCSRKILNEAHHKFTILIYISILPNRLWSGHSWPASSYGAILSLLGQTLVPFKSDMWRSSWAACINSCFSISSCQILSLLCTSRFSRLCIIGPVNTSMKWHKALL